MNWILLLAAIVCEVAATSALKLTDDFTRPLPSIGVIAGYLLSLYLFCLVIKTMSLGIAYAVWSGLGLVLVVLIGWLGFGQKLDLAAQVGLFFILIGILIIHLLSKTTIY